LSQENMRRCTCCTGNFDIELEGGAEGYIGILPVVVCPTECPNCGKFEDDDE